MPSFFSAKATGCQFSAARTSLVEKNVFIGMSLSQDVRFYGALERKLKSLRIPPQSSLRMFFCFLNGLLVELEKKTFPVPPTIKIKFYSAPKKDNRTQSIICKNRRVFKFFHRFSISPQGAYLKRTIEFWRNVCTLVL